MENKKAKNVLLAVMGVLIVAEIIIRIATIQAAPVSAVSQILSLLFAALYIFWLYKKPHGNILKCAMLIFAFANIIGGSYFLLLGQKYQLAKVLASAAVCYCAGRLNRIDQNKYLMPIIGVVFLAVSINSVRLRFINQTATVLIVFRALNFTINYLALMIAYFVRYDEHKEAGLADAPKK